MTTMRHFTFNKLRSEKKSYDANSVVLDRFNLVRNSFPSSSSPNELLQGGYESFRFWMTFNSPEDQAAYQKETAHDVFVKIAKPLWKKVIVYDSIGIK